MIQPETKEIILIEDGSKDDSLQVCKNLQSKYAIVTLYTHKGNCNKGAGASRNVGIIKATGDYIAFLDADDFFLPDRFRAERKIFIEKPEIDGVYGALGYSYYSEIGESRFKEFGYGQMTTISETVPSKELFLVLVWLHEKATGHFHIDALTLKRKVFFGKTDMWNNLKLHEDSVFFLQLSLNCLLEPGIINEPIGCRGVHDNNRIVNRSKKSNSNVLKWHYLTKWAKRTSKGRSIVTLFKLFMIKEKILISKGTMAFFLFIWYSISNRAFVTQGLFFNPCCIQIFGKKYAWYIINLKDKIYKKIFKRNRTLVGLRLSLIEEMNNNLS